jgi:hypothetical protein
MHHDITVIQGTTSQFATQQFAPQAGLQHLVVRCLNAGVIVKIQLIPHDATRRAMPDAQGKLPTRFSLLHTLRSGPIIRDGQRNGGCGSSRSMWLAWISSRPCRIPHAAHNVKRAPQDGKPQLFWQDV